MDLIQVTTWLALILGALIGIPQIVKTFQTQSARDVSAKTFVLMAGAALCLLVRAIATRETAFIFYAAFVIASSLLQLFLIWRCRMLDRSIQFGDASTLLDSFEDKQSIYK